VEPEVHQRFVRRPPQPLILLVLIVQFLSDRVTTTSHLYNDVLSGLFTADKLNKLRTISSIRTFTPHILSLAFPKLLSIFFGKW